MAAHVKLATHTLPVPAQPWPIVCDVLGVADPTEMFSRGEEIMATLRARFTDRPFMELHALLSEFIPTLPERLPLHEWGGYASPEAMQVGDRDRETAKKAPDLDQIAAAVETVILVNGGERLGKLLALGQQIQATLPQNGATAASPISLGGSGEST